MSIANLFLHTAQKKSSIGVIDQTELLSAESYCQQTELQLLDMKNKLFSSKERLKRIMLGEKLNEERDFTLQASDKPPVLSDFQKFYQMALSHSLDYALLNQKIKETNMKLELYSDVKKQKCSLFIHFNTTVWNNKQSVSSHYDQSFWNTVEPDDVVVGFKVKLSNVSVNKANIKECVEEKEKNLICKERLKRNMRHEIFIVYQDLKNSYKKMKKIRKMILLQGKKQNHLTKKYNIGQINVESVIDSQKDFMQIQNKLVQERVFSNLLRTQLQFLLGTFEEKV